MQLNANQNTNPQPPVSAWQAFLDKAGPWAMVGAIAYLVFKGGRYGA